MVFIHEKVEENQEEPRFQANLTVIFNDFDFSYNQHFFSVWSACL